jgi:hypothetical protein
VAITFLDSSNSDIDHLVGLCAPEATAPPSGVLLTPPLEDLSELPDELDEEYAEPDNEPPLAVPRGRQIDAYPFSAARRLISDLIVAVDSGVITLGQMTGGGVAFAIRGAAVCSSGKTLLILRYNTGALLITPDNRLQVFRYIGERLGTPDLYVRQETRGLVPKMSMIDTVNQITDRCRNFVERMIQAEAVGLLAENHGGLLLIDGALAISYDTPKNYLSDMLGHCRRNAVDVCAISKRSNIVIGGLPIDALFDQYPTFVGYAPLLAVLEEERAAYDQGTMRAGSDVTAGTELYAARFGFGPPGLTFRVDVNKSGASTNDDVINDVYDKCPMYGGYPKPLIDAHHYSAFLGGDAITLLADLVVQTGIRVKEQPSLGVLFQPFGAFGK